VTGLAPVADLALLRAGVTLRLRDRLAAFSDFGAALGQDFNAQSLEFGLQLSF
jgi:uncharacterized protein with beta-barrel porin domain